MEEKLEIRNCPICGGKHTYKLKVERTSIMMMMNIADLKEKPQPVEITRIFPCPVKNEKFEVTFKLDQTSGEKIKSVTVEGVVGNEEEEKKQKKQKKQKKEKKEKDR